MEEGEFMPRHLWSHLTTVTRFDEGNDQWSTKCLDDFTEEQVGGNFVDKVVPSTSLLIESLLQQLCTMLEKRQSRRKKLYIAICDKLHEMKLIDNSYHMADFEMIRNHYQQALYHLVAVARTSINKETVLQVPSCFITDWSRYHQEFQEISFIGSGGFGNVFRALNRLDGIEYAIKKIVVKSNRVNTIMQHLVEVKTIARLNHTNIVPYKGAWIEPALESTLVQRLSLTSQNRENHMTCAKFTSSENKSHQSDSIKGTELWACQNQSNYQSTEVTQENSMHKASSANNKSPSCVKARAVVEDIISHSISFRNETEENERKSICQIRCDGEEISLSSITSESDSGEESLEDRRICEYNTPVSRQYCTLYIQMALCGKTLREWLDERVGATPQKIIAAIVMQILNGLAYIHSLGIVHHDIKPSNIFISTIGQLQVQLGDFGLACPLQRENHHSVLGTRMYAAPEQLNGECNPKSDVYSLGIVLIEMLIPMQTFMECSRVVEALKLGHMPMELTATYPKWAVVVSRLLQKDPAKRPTTGELLKELRMDKDSTIAKLKHDNNKKSNVIEELQAKVAALEEEISRLKILSNKRI